MAIEAQFHVLAVDDNLIDRKLIEKLLKTSSFQGMLLRDWLISPLSFDFYFGVLIVDFCGVFWTVTAVDSGSKALEFLGLQEEEQRNHHPQVWFSHWFSSTHSFSFLGFFDRCLIFLFPFVIWQEMEVNLIITDYSMPGMTGYDLLRKIKVSSFSWWKLRTIFEAKTKNQMNMILQESSSLKDIPVVIMSSENIPSRINRWGKYWRFWNWILLIQKKWKFVDSVSNLGLVNGNWSDVWKKEQKISSWSRSNYRMWASLDPIYWEEKLRKKKKNPREILEKERQLKRASPVCWWRIWISSSRLKTFLESWIMNSHINVGSLDLRIFTGMLIEDMNSLWSFIERQQWSLRRLSLHFWKNNQKSSGDQYKALKIGEKTLKKQKVEDLWRFCRALKTLRRKFDPPMLWRRIVLIGYKLLAKFDLKSYFQSM